jgi:hypothetical protein
MGVALALSGQNLKERLNNQLSVDISGGSDSGEVVLGGGASGETLWNKEKNNANNLHGGVNWLPTGKSTHDNQPKEVVWDRSAGNMRYHRVGGDKVQIESVKLK